MYIVNIEEPQIIITKIYIVFLSLKIDIVLIDSADSNKMLHDVAFHLGFRCLPYYPFKGQCLIVVITDNTHIFLRSSES